MTTAIAVVSVIASSLVAIVVPLIAGRLETRRLMLQVDAGRLDELRAVLDRAAPALRAALYELNGAESLLSQGLKSAVGGGPTIVEVLEQLSERNTEVLEFVQRLKLRLGQRARLVTLYEAAGGACADGWYLLTDVTFNDAPYDDARAAAVRFAIDSAERSQSEFLEESARLVGPTAMGV